MVVPEKGRRRVVSKLRQAHPGMKSLSRCCLGIDQDLELCVKSCEACLVNQKSPPDIGGLGLTSHGQEYILIMLVQCPCW